MFLSISYPANRKPTRQDILLSVIILVPVISWLTFFQLYATIPTEQREHVNINALPRVDKALTGHYLIYEYLPYSVVVCTLCSLPYLFHFFLPFFTGARLLSNFSFSSVLCRRKLLRSKSQRRCWRCRRRKFSSWIFVFGLVNVLAVTIQVYFPTAPPWWYTSTLHIRGAEHHQEESNGTELSSGEMIIDASAQQSQEYSDLTVEQRTLNTRKRLSHVHNGTHVDESFILLYDEGDISYDTLPDGARLADVDQALGVSLFASIYGQSPLVFGSFPSLHASWPVICFSQFLGAVSTSSISAFFTSLARVKNIPIYIYWCWIWFAAIYLGHHFVTDVIGALLLCTFAFLVKRVLFMAFSIPNKYDTHCQDCPNNRETLKRIFSEGIWADTATESE